MKECNCGVFDQTPKESLQVLNKSKVPDEEPGTGIFLVPAPELGIMECKKVAAPDPITYIECTKRASGTVAFKWIANAYKSHASTIKAVTTGKCDHVLCAGGTR